MICGNSIIINNGKEASILPFLLLYFLITVNVLITVAYIREHNLNEIMTTEIKKGFIEINLSEKLCAQKEELRKSDKANKGKTWESIKILLSIINSENVKLTV